MSQTSGIDRRVHPRHPLTESVEFFHAPTKRNFPAFCRDISHGGMLMYVPAATPVAPGQSVSLRLAEMLPADKSALVVAYRRIGPPPTAFAPRSSWSRTPDNAFTSTARSASSARARQGRGLDRTALQRSLAAACFAALLA